jgi:hypothetical protein
LKKYVVNSVGALQWMRDANEYATVFEQANVAMIDDLFQHLKDIASLFLIKPVSFKDCVSTCSLSRMSHADLQDFIRIRGMCPSRHVHRHRIWFLALSHCDSFPP